MQLKDATLLIVDDEDTLLEIFQRWFEREGCRVLTAANGRDALDLAAANVVDLVISDIRMPVLDGLELVRRLAERDGYLPKIIFISGFGDVGDREIFGIGVEAMLHKPVDRADLVAAARRSLTDRGELWRTPPVAAPAIALDLVFASVAAARQQGLIAFGRGGFCVRSDLAARVGTRVRLQLEFTADAHALIGQGVVRWTDPREEQIGVEITYVDDAQCAWVAALTERAAPAAFIPKTSADPAA